jgi:hypothetical protein
VGREDAAEDAFAISPVLAPVSDIEVVIEAVVNVCEGDVVVDAACRDMALVADLRRAEPSGGWPVDRSNVRPTAAPRVGSRSPGVEA